MTWLYRNINHFTYPLGMLLSLFAVTVSYRGIRRRKAGLSPQVLGRRATIMMWCVILVCCFLLGIAVVRNFVRI